MKRMSLLPTGAAALLLACAACTEEISEVQPGTLKQIVMTAPDFETETGSRTNFQITSAGAEFAWAANDTVGIFPNEGAQAYFPMTSGAGTKSANFTGGGWALKDAATYAAYYPFVGNFYLDKNAIPVNYTGQIQTGNASTAHLGAYDYMAAAPTAPKNGNVSFAFKHLGALVQLKLTVPQPATITSVTLATEGYIFAATGKIVLMDNPCIGLTTYAKEITLGVKELTTTEVNQVVTLYVMLPPTHLSDQTLKAVVKTTFGTEEVILDSKNFQAGKAYALSGSLRDPNGGAPAGNGTYKDGVVSVDVVGNMKRLLGDDYLSITSLKVVGPINGDDVYYLRKMLGAPEFNEIDRGKLSTLDLSEASIVEGGEWYYDNSSTYQGEKYYTSNNLIGTLMFHKCTNLQQITLPKNTTSIEGSAFYGCNALASVVIPNSVTSIGFAAFADCKNLTSITIPSNITSIGYSAFFGCGITDVYITDLSAWCKIDFSDYDSNPLVNNAKFFLNGLELTELTIPKDITEIKDYTFVRCKTITKVTIPDYVTSIGSGAFYDCDALTTITIPQSVTSIGSGAFEDCDALTAITIPDDVTSIGENAFYDCDALKEATILSGEIGNYAFYGCGILASTIIGDDVTSIGRGTFQECEKLNKVVFGKSLEKIGQMAFSFCSIIECYCYATTPPILEVTWNDKNPTTFHLGVTQEAKLYVPARCGVTYERSEWRNYFNRIEEMD